MANDDVLKNINEDDILVVRDLKKYFPVGKNFFGKPAGYVKAVDVVKEGNFETIKITLKYGADKNEKILTGIKRISKPGLRVYASKDELPKVLGGLGVAIISTNKGVLTDKAARKENVGGEVLAFVW